jgi:hypothetical protein
MKKNISRLIQELAVQKRESLRIKQAEEVKRLKEEQAPFSKVISLKVKTNMSKGFSQGKTKCSLCVLSGDFIQDIH